MPLFLFLPCWINFAEQNYFSSGKIIQQGELIIKKNKNMEKEKCDCPQCKIREVQEQEAEEMNFAVLVALVPVLTITLFNTVGLI